MAKQLPERDRNTSAAARKQAAAADNTRRNRLWRDLALIAIAPALLYLLASVACTATVTLHATLACCTCWPACSPIRRRPTRAGPVPARWSRRCTTWAARWGRGSPTCCASCSVMSPT
ncbi:hypothetical protein STPYR_10663 [uncultured Stenotrophomonas sp.]|uniref:Uncharacterized protein n=1 Tax=uncultured Stenotrophomonas sp. TaxID=165438 RepID=A0A1Y5Q0F8_9GAMM|nr:hypothetical protein STPYR_10663 [uncultured Stenotrophomonas sp.]